MKPVARDQAFTVEGAAAFKGLPITVIRDAVNSGELGHCRHADFDVVK